MKVKDILLEYDRFKTIDQMGNAIANAAKNDPALTNPRIKDQELSSEQVSALSRNVLGQAEATIAQHPFVALRYARYIINGRFLKGEEAIRTDPAAKSQYKQRFGVDLDKEAGQK